MRKNIDINDDLVADIAYLAAKEKRRGKTDTKNFIEDLVESYVIKKKESVRKKQGGSNNA
jgi:hypothetical protein